MTIVDTDTKLWDPVHEALADPDVHLIAWDGCHKVYIAQDDEQAEWFRDNYPHVVEGSCEDLLVVLASWWERSCSFRFISGVRTNHENPNAGFTTLIGQFAEEEAEAAADDE